MLSHHSFAYLTEENPFMPASFEFPFRYVKQALELRAIVTCAEIYAF